MEPMSMDSDTVDLQLLLANLNTSEVIDIMDELYCGGQPDVEDGTMSTFCENNENEDRSDSLLLSGQIDTFLSKVSRGTVKDLLDFANQVSNTTKQMRRAQEQESGIILKETITVKGGRYRIHSDVLLFPWKLTYRNIDSGFVPQGAFGKVHLAQDRETRTRMACKLIPVEQFKPADIEIQAHFQHENIAELFGAVLWDETIHLFMEAGEGGSVMEKLETCGPMREFEIIWVTKHVLKGLEFLHSKGVIHHDIKPSNIVIMSTKAALVDFGLSVQLNEDMYYPKDLRGTEIYMSPEVILCRGHSTKTDIYSMGATLIHMQTGSPPWVKRYPRSAYPSYLYIGKQAEFKKIYFIERHSETSIDSSRLPSLSWAAVEIHKQAPPLEDIAEDCSPTMRDLIKASLERNPNQRSSATELLKHEALHPPPEDQPRCQSLDTALFERKRLLRKDLELPENIIDSSLFMSEESDVLKRQRSLSLDLGALAGYFNIVRGPPEVENEDL